MRPRIKKKNFTLIEIMFVVGILVILIGISWVSGSKILRKTAEAQTKAELVMILKACDAYKVRWGSYPKADGYNGPVDFMEMLSKVSADSSQWGSDRPRPMFIDCKKANMNITNDDYANTGTGAVSAKDPYEQDYTFQISEGDPAIDGDGVITIFSVGIDPDDDSDDVYIE